ncbi:MAG: hypothetical protein CL916_04400 [Deltaproteobacteria bacterium]|nr:hypothetical protein [Deltaproteobacteria bacterium]
MSVLVFLFACTAEDPRVDLMKSWGEKIFIPSYQSFVEKTQSLHASTIPFCADPNLSSLTDLQQAWWDARAPWKQMEILAFGPYKSFPERLGPKIDFWPIRKDTVDEILVGEQSLAPEVFDSFGVSSKGLPVVEYLLYSVLPADIQSERGCEYLIGSTYDLSQKAETIYNAWSPDGENYLGHLTEPALHEGDYQTIEDSLAEVVNRLSHTIENIRADKIQKGLGSEVGEVQVSLVESHFSHRSLQDIRNNLEGIHAVYFGADQGLGIDDYLLARGYNLDEDFTQRYERCMETINSLEQNGTLVDNMYVDSQGVLYLSDQLAALQTFIKGEIIGAMSLWLTFNDADGD